MICVVGLVNWSELFVGDMCCRCGVLVGTVCMICVVGVVDWLERFVGDMCCQCGELVGTVCR